MRNWWTKKFHASGGPGGKHMCNNKPQRMHKYHSETTGWLQDSNKGQVHGKKKKKNKEGEAGARGDDTHVINTPLLVIWKESFIMKAGSNFKAATDTRGQGRAPSIVYSRCRRQGGPTLQQ